MKVTKSIIIQILGWYGVVAILLAYALLSFDIIPADGVVYQLLNLTGALGIILAAYAKKDMQPVVLNIVWLIIAAVALVGVVLR